MPFIKLSNGETLDTSAITSYEPDTEILQEEPPEVVGRSDQAKQVARTVLTIMKNDGETIKLRGADADAALEVLKYS